MKLIIVLLMLMSRELLTTPQWRGFIVAPACWWRDVWLNIAQKQQLNASAVLVLLALLPIFVFAAVLFALQHSYAVGWQLVWAMIILVPVFVDRQLPTVLTIYKEQWSVNDNIDKEIFDMARHQLFSTHIKELFTPLFWIFLLGVWGVLLVSFYYLCRLCQEQTQHTELSEVAQKVLWYVDWLPSHALVLSFALVGQFMPTWRYWLTRWNDVNVMPQDLVKEAADIAKDGNSHHDTPNQHIVWLNALADDEALCLRVVVLWVMLLVLQLV